jgi:hypothetical protein
MVVEDKYRIEFLKFHLDMDFGRWGLDSKVPDAQSLKL